MENNLLQRVKALELVCDVIVQRLGPQTLIPLARDRLLVAQTAHQHSGLTDAEIAAFEAAAHRLLAALGLGEAPAPQRE